MCNERVAHVFVTSSARGAGHDGGDAGTGVTKC
jgi:hypothetical protein